VVILIVVPTFAGLCFWQIRRALGGNDLSWAYVFEWPFFAGYAVYMWWRLLHEPVPPRMRRTSTSAARPTDPALLAGSADLPSDGTGAAEPTATVEPTGASDPTGEADAIDPDEADRAAYNRYLSDLAARGKRKQWR
jgi:hypothetical protein